MCSFLCTSVNRESRFGIFASDPVKVAPPLTSIKWRISSRPRHATWGGGGLLKEIKYHRRSKTAFVLKKKGIFCPGIFDIYLDQNIDLPYPQHHRWE